MSNSFYWSSSAGRWMGVPVRLHFLLFLFIALIFATEWNHISNEVIGSAVITTIVLLASLILHELAHVFAISNLGGHVNHIVLAPWGGISDFTLPESERAKSIVFLAGPFANAMVVALVATLLIQTDQAALSSLVNPFNPHSFRITDWELSMMKIVAWVNFQIMLVNLIPCFPFDGAGVLRSVVQMVNPNLPREQSETTIRVIGHAVALTAIGMAWFLRDYHVGPYEPVWLLLLVLGITLLFSARYSYFMQTMTVNEDWDEDLDELDYESLYDEPSFFGFPEDESAGYSQWLAEKQDARRREEARIEKEEARRADEILKKLHREGAESLTDEDKAILNRVSERIRLKRNSSEV